MTRSLLLTALTALTTLTACGGNTGNAGPVDAQGPDGPNTVGDAGGDASAARDPAEDGDSTVTTAVVAIPGSTASRTVPATVFVPTPSTHALVVISPGFQLDRTQYTSYAHHLATWGFVVVLTDYADRSFFAAHQPLADDVGAVIDWALAQPAYAIDATRIATAGHSLGGDISVLAATGDARIKAVVGWDPVDASSPSVVPEKMSTLTAALAVIGETTNASGGGMPCAPSAENFTQFYAAAPAPALQLTIHGADHMDWVDDPSCLVCTLCTAGSEPAATTRTATRRLDVAWLRSQLLADPAMAPWLAQPPEVTAGKATVARK